MKLLNIFKSFKNDEAGAVTVDWVVLTAAIVGLGLVVMTDRRRRDHDRFGRRCNRHHRETRRPLLRAPDRKLTTISDVNGHSSGSGRFFMRCRATTDGR